MGACTVVRAHPRCDKATLKKWVEATQQEMAFTRGASYSGEWNMCYGVAFHEAQTFKSVDEAEKYLHSVMQKGGNLIAVPAQVPRDLPRDISQADTLWLKLQEAHGELNRAINRYPLEVLKRVQSGKSTLKTCTNCSSKISVAHVHDTFCPVCRAEFLYTPSDIKAIAVMKRRREEVRQKWKAREEKLASKHFKGDLTEDLWVVGGLCAM